MMGRRRRWLWSYLSLKQRRRKLSTNRVPPSSSRFGKDPPKKIFFFPFYLVLNTLSHVFFCVTLIFKRVFKPLCLADVERLQQLILQALCRAEDEEDIVAASQAKAEQVAELAEFNENIPLDDGGEQEEMEELSKAEQEIAALVEQVTNTTLFF